MAGVVDTGRVAQRHARWHPLDEAIDSGGERLDRHQSTLELPRDFQRARTPVGGNEQVDPVRLLRDLTLGGEGGHVGHRSESLALMGGRLFGDPDHGSHAGESASDVRVALGILPGSMP